MKTYLRHFLFVFVSLFYINSTFGVTYNYTSLIFQDYKNLKPIVRNSISESRSYRYPKDGDKVVAPLRKTLKMLFSRPDNDDLIRKLAPELISELRSLGVFHQTINEIVKAGQDEVAEKSLNPRVRTTALIMLNNLLLFIRPQILDDTQLAQTVCQLADQDMTIPTAVKKDSKLTTMFNSTSPTDLAKKIMMWYAKKKNKDVQASKKGCPFSHRA